MNPEGGSDIFRLARDKSPEAFLKVEMEDALSTGFFGFDKTRDLMLPGRQPRAEYGSSIRPQSLDGREKTLLAEDPRSDFSGLMTHPTEKNVQAVAFYYDRIHWTALDPSIARDMDYLHNVEQGDMMVVSRSLDDKQWIVAFSADNSPSRYYRYDRDIGKAVFLFTDRKKLEGQSLARMVPAIIKVARRPGSGQLLHSASGQRRERRRISRPSLADGSVRTRRTLGPRLLGSGSYSPVAGKPGLCRPERQLPRLDRSWQELRQCRKPGMGQEDA